MRARQAVGCHRIVTRRINAFMKPDSPFNGVKGPNLPSAKAVALKQRVV